MSGHTGDEGRHKRIRQSGIVAEFESRKSQRWIRWLHRRYYRVVKLGVLRGIQVVEVRFVVYAPPRNWIRTRRNVEQTIARSKAALVVVAHQILRVGCEALISRIEKVMICVVHECRRYRDLKLRAMVTDA